MRVCKFKAQSEVMCIHICMNRNADIDQDLTYDSQNKQPHLTAIVEERESIQQKKKETKYGRVVFSLVSFVA